MYDGPFHLQNITARAWPPGAAPLAVRGSNGFQMAAASSVQGFRPEGASYRFLVQARSLFVCLFVCGGAAPPAGARRLRTGCMRSRAALQRHTLAAFHP